MTSADRPILNVDDNEPARYARTRVLQNAGYTVIEAGTAADALRRVNEVRPALVLLDVALPDGNGLDVCRQIKRDFPSTLVLQVSATYTGAHHKALGLEAGADSYLAEPAEPAELLANVQALLRLRDAEAELQRLNETLERRVIERTSELAEVNSQLLQSQKLEAIGQLTGGIAHDFNNLLAAVLGNLQLVRKRCAHDKEALALIDGAIEGALRGATLTQRLLVFARRKELDAQSVDLAALIAGMIDMVRRSIGSAIRVNVLMPPDLWPILVDPDQLELAILNLAVNARDAMPDGGTLTIAALNETLSAPRGDLSPGDYVRLSVADTGMGMDESTLARAVDPFFTTKGVGKGTGLGLSMIQGLAAQSGGALYLSSRVGAGTIAELWLRRGGAVASRPASAAAGPPPASAPDRQPRTVLLVEDDPLILTTAVAMLKDIGHDVIEAFSGQQAIERLNAGAKVDIVVTDQGMPGMTGLQLAARIRERWPDMPILVTTGYAELPSEPQLRLPRLSKPYDQDDLADAIALAVSNRERRAANG